MRGFVSSVRVTAADGSAAKSNHRGGREDNGGVNENHSGSHEDNSRGSGEDNGGGR